MNVHDRMPVLLQPEDFPRWLAGTASTEMLKPAPDDYLQAWPVSRRVNSSRTPSDDPTLIDQIADLSTLGVLNQIELRSR
jgi:putative SOS response-associated peptidase YedK